MRSRESLNSSSHRVGTSRLAWVASGVLGLLGIAFAAHAQNGALTAAPNSPAKAASDASAGETWLSLTTPEKTSLAPLEKSWNGLSEGQKRKWLAIAKTYPTLSIEGQEKLHSRMVEWAALSPKDREVARLNFAQSKTIAKSDRAANWQAYQALSPEEREKLAQGAKPKPVGAAVAVKPVAPEKLTAVPVTRHTPDAERKAAAQQSAINRTTLLPLLPAATASAPAPQALATPPKP